MVSSYPRRAVIVHGGAGSLSDDKVVTKVPGLAQARDAAWDVLSAGGDSLAAVGAALRILEELPYFNAGYGSYPDAQGRIFMDVGVMQGDLSFASLLNVERVTYPSVLAVHHLRSSQLSLMRVWTPTQMAALEAASEDYRRACGLVESHQQLLAPFVRELLATQDLELSMKSGTVGCVVRDDHGQLCAGTSTGGINAKPDGRIGDSPIIGCGVYADSTIAALSTTGVGESFLGSLVSGFIVAEMRRAISVDHYCFSKDIELLRSILAREFEQLTQKYGEDKGGAIIVIPLNGTPAFSFNTEMVSLGYRYFDHSGSEVKDARIERRFAPPLR